MYTYTYICLCMYTHIALVPTHATFVYESYLFLAKWQAHYLNTNLMRSRLYWNEDDLLVYEEYPSL